MRITEILKCLLPSFLVLSVAQAQSLPKLKTGDLLFQNLDCGPLCDAIEEVTDGYLGNDFSHIGLVYIKGDSTFVIEAIGADVHLTPLNSFASRYGNKVFAGRVKSPYEKIATQAVSTALTYIGTPYDDVFLYDNGKYYCSEMIYDAFKKANGGKPFFTLEPMTFRPPGKKEYYPVWISYYEKLNAPIPQGEPGINPGGISRSSKITILN